MSYEQRVKGGAILLVLAVSLINALLFAKENNIVRVSVGSDIVSRNERRFAEIKRMLPSQGIVGYVSDLTLEVGPIGIRTEFSDEKYELQYALTQYALSPLVVDIKSEGHEFVVGNFAKGSDPHETARAAGLRLVKDFGNGIMLFKQAE